MSLYWFSLVQIVSGLLIYQASQKVVPKETNPFLFTAASYAVGILLCTVAGLYTHATSGGGLSLETAGSPWTQPKTWICALGLGLGATLIEVGYFSGYRHGWAISELPLFVMVSTAICLLIAGLLIWNESVSISKTLGLLLCIFGFILILRK